MIVSSVPGAPFVLLAAIFLAGVNGAPPPSERALDDEEPLVPEHAAWAYARIR
jgi:hypothetical protein